jgi:hypothetical protein
MTKLPSRPRNLGTHANRQIVGFSLSPALASEVKVEASQRSISLKVLFEEMWALYQKDKNKKSGK